MGRVQTGALQQLVVVHGLVDGRRRSAGILGGKAENALVDRGVFRVLGKQVGQAVEGLVGLGVRRAVLSGKPADLRRLAGLVVGHAVDFHEHRLRVALGVWLAVGGHAGEGPGALEQVRERSGGVHGEVVCLQAIHLGIQGVGGLRRGAERDHAEQRATARRHSAEQVGDALGGRARIHDGRRDVGVGGAQIAPGYLLSIFFDIVVEGAEGVETHGIV